jgi:hypothetical protein
MANYTISSKKEKFEIKIYDSRPGGGTSFNMVVDGYRVMTPITANLFAHRCQNTSNTWAVSCSLTGGSLFTGAEGETRKLVVEKALERLITDDGAGLELLQEKRKELAI